MAWTTPKTDWDTNPKSPKGEDFNRIEGNIDFLKTDIETKKGAVVNALDGVGLDVDITDTHSEIATKITNSDQGTKILTPTTSNITIAKGFHSGAGYVKGDADLTSGNIKKDVDIFGVIGSHLDVETSVYQIGRLYTLSTHYYIRELNPNTFSKINELEGTYRDLEGIGGVEGRLYFAGEPYDGSGEYRLAELNPDTLTIIRSVAGSKKYGVGGTSTKLFCCDSTKIYELNPGTLGIIKTVTSPIDSLHGIGGTSTRLYSGNYDIFAEFNPNTLAIINSVDPPYNLSGMGGILNRLYGCKYYYDGGYAEFNPDTLIYIKTIDTDDSPHGIGGIKSGGQTFLKIDTLLEGASLPDGINYLNKLYIR